MNRIPTRIVLVAFAVVAIAGALAYRHYWLARPVGEGPAGPTVPREPFGRPWSDRKVLLVGLGDSVTGGFGVGEEHSYLGRLVENPRDEWPELNGTARTWKTRTTAVMMLCGGCS